MHHQSAAIHSLIDAIDIRYVCDYIESITQNIFGGSLLWSREVVSAFLPQLFSPLLR